jgi:hydroxypyruvate reductase
MVAAAAQHRADAVLIATNLRLDAPTIRAVPDHVRIVGSFGVGFDHIDVAAARAKGLIVTNTPDVVTDCTADTTMLLILGACRRAGEYEAIMRRGWREPLGDRMGRKVSGKTLGILGLGRIGRAVAQRARGFEMRILYHDMARLPAELEQGAQFFPTLEAMLPHCDILSIHANLSPATTRIINDRTLALLPKGAVFVNAARGGFVDEDALVRALQSGHLFAAGLDVFDAEPDFDLRFRDLPNTFLLPHAGTATTETRVAMGMKVLDNIAAVCAGRAPIDPLWN